MPFIDTAPTLTRSVRARARVARIVTVGLFVGATLVACSAGRSFADCSGDGYVCDGWGHGRQCTDGAWVEFSDGPCGPSFADDCRRRDPLAEGCPCSQPGSIRCDNGVRRCSAEGRWTSLAGPCPTDPDSGQDGGADSSEDASPVGDASSDAPLDGDAGSCPADLAATLGQVCGDEGRFCGSCGDPCQFCNVIRCERGVWVRVEVPPLPCDAGRDG